MEHNLYLISYTFFFFLHKTKIDNFGLYDVLLAISTNIPVLLVSTVTYVQYVLSIPPFIISDRLS